MKKLGPLARIGPNHVITNDPEVTRKILAVRSRYRRARWFDAMSIDPHIRNIISEKDSEKHNQLRSKLASSYSSKALASAENVVNERMLDWLERVKSQWMSDMEGGRGPSKTFDIGTRIQYLTIDIISKICLGVEFGYVASDSDSLDLLETIQRGSAACQLFSLFLEMNTVMGYLAKIPFLAKLFIPSPADRTGIGRVMGVIRRRLDEIEDPKKNSSNTMLESFLDKGVSKEQVVGEMVIALVGGADTTPTSIQVTLLAIILNPRVYGKLKREISDAVRRGIVSTPIIKSSEAKRLPYLQACILEGLRTFPPLAQLREREVPPEGDIINGYHVPGGTFIGLNMWGTQLDPVFGEDPEVFRPERWLIDDDDPRKLKEMHNTQDLIFSYGSTKCLGMTLAIMEISKMVFEVRTNHLSWYP
ncbi:MAG: hypothetical protein M1831_003668 [Alyxoria varia]|nr:MAG: hypothetical protein M1831_003668 [Alyxoria varia]